MKKRRFFPQTLLGGLVLLAVILAAIGLGGGKKNPLFDRNSSVTLYAATPVGKEPDLSPETYFPRDEEEYEDLDYGKFTFDLAGCDLDAPGTYEIPVYYGGERTVCTVELEVTAPVDLTGFEGQSVRQ